MQIIETIVVLILLYFAYMYGTKKKKKPAESPAPPALPPDVETPFIPPPNIRDVLIDSISIIREEEYTEYQETEVKQLESSNEQTTNVDDIASKTETNVDAISETKTETKVNDLITSQESKVSDLK